MKRSDSGCKGDISCTRHVVTHEPGLRFGASSSEAPRASPPALPGGELERPPFRSGASAGLVLGSRSRRFLSVRTGGSQDGLPGDQADWDPKRGAGGPARAPRASPSASSQAPRLLNGIHRDRSLAMPPSCPKRRRRPWRQRPRGCGRTWGARGPPAPTAREPGSLGEAGVWRGRFCSCPPSNTFSKFHVQGPCTQALALGSGGGPAGLLGAADVTRRHPM